MFEYRAVGNRCAVVLDALNLPISSEEALEMIAHKGFKVLEVDLVALARQRIGASHYWRGARFSEAPAIVDCSCLTKWLFAQHGVWLPRLSIQQYEFGEIIGLSENVTAHDLVFTSGRRSYYRDDPKRGIGHVGMATGDGTIIHAANSRRGVVETPIEDFMSGNKFRGIRRYFPNGAEAITLEIPAERSVETSDDIRWIILQSLPKRMESDQH